MPIEATRLFRPEILRPRVATEKIRTLIQIAKGTQEVIANLHDWLQVEFGVEKPGHKLSERNKIDSDTFVAEVKKRRAGQSTAAATELWRLREEFDRATVPLREGAPEALQLETEISDLGNDAYGLMPEEVDLLWRTAPPRMPTVVGQTGELAVGGA